MQTKAFNYPLVIFGIFSSFYTIILWYRSVLLTCFSCKCTCTNLLIKLAPPVGEQVANHRRIRLICHRLGGFSFSTELQSLLSCHERASSTVTNALKTNKTNRRLLLNFRFLIAKRWIFAQLTHRTRITTVNWRGSEKYMHLRATVMSTVWLTYRLMQGKHHHTALRLRRITMVVYMTTSIG